MRINQNKVKERLAGVPDSERVHIYDAQLVIRFLEEVFVPTAYFLGEYRPGPASQIDLPAFETQAKEKDRSIGDLYDVYVLWREKKDYTKPIESKYVFSLIIKRLRFYRNGWEFFIFRRGVAQIWHAGPIVFRKDMSPGELERYAPKKHGPTVEESMVPVPVPQVDRFVEAHDRFTETE